MTNPFLDFSHAMLQYDMVLYGYLFVMGLTFVLLIQMVPGVGSTESTQAADASNGIYCPLLRNEDTDTKLLRNGWRLGFW